jgi:hypothetical protein
MTVQSDAPPTTGDETNHAGTTLPGGCPLPLAATLHAPFFRRIAVLDALMSTRPMFDFTTAGANSEPMGGLAGSVRRGVTGART